MKSEDKGFDGELGVTRVLKVEPTVPCFNQETEEELPRTMGYWIAGSDGKAKSYLEATPEETLNFTKSLLPEILPPEVELLLEKFNEENLLLAGNRAYLIGFTLKTVEASRRHSLFGRQIEWDKIEEWVRLNRTKDPDTGKKDSGED